MTRFAVACVALLGGFAVPAGSQTQDFVFERLWPAIQQPWYFVNTRGIAVDGDDNVFVVDSFNHRIQRFSTEGQFTSRFGTEGVDPGQFMFPISIATDARGNVYVAETDTIDFRRIQKLSQSGEPLLQFGSFGDGPGQFGVGVPEDNGFSPFDLEIDSEGNIWVSGSNRIQRFDPDGNFVSAIPAFGSTDDPFELLTGFDVAADGSVFAFDDLTSEVIVFDPRGNELRRFGRFGFGPGEIFIGNDIELDDQGRIYIADGGNSKVIRFDANERDFIEWGELGNRPGQFQFVWRLDFDSAGQVFTVDASGDDFGIHRVQKFTSDGEFLQEWGSASTQAGRFITPDGVAVDSQGRIFVADAGNDRVQIFSPRGQFLNSFGEDQLTRPTRVAIGPAPDEKIYVTEFEAGRVLRFTSDGQFDNASFDGLELPAGLAVDRTGSVYVSEVLADRIRKFDADLNQLLDFGGHTECIDSNGFELPCVDAAFNEPRSLTIDRSGASDQILVGDYFNLRIQRFDTEGNFVGKFNSTFFPTAIRADGAGNVYLLPFSNSRGSDGHFVAVLGPTGDILNFFGEYGSNPGQLNSPTDLALTPDGRVVVADALNHRVVTFTSADAIPDAKAIIVAGGGPFPGNTLWQATQLNANFAYRALSQQGFTKETIQYLSADQALDLDGNGLADDVDGDATVANLNQAITEWAADAAEVIVYLVDHGGDQTFRMGGTELLPASRFSTMIEDLQNQIPGRITVVYDACQSGSFIASLSDPVQDRVVLTSAATGQSAFFVDNGALSFSNHFWTQVFNGASVGDAYGTAREITEASFPGQNPQLDADGDGTTNTGADLDRIASQFIGNGAPDNGERPTIDSVSPSQNIASGNSAGFFADGVTDNNGISRVWGVVRPPGDVRPRDPNDPVRELPRFDFVFTNPERTRWQGQFDGFDTAGTYTVTINAADAIGNRAVPRVTTVTVESPLSRRAIIVDALGSPGSKGMSGPAQIIMQALTAQDYSSDEVTLLSDDDSMSSGTPDLSGVTTAIQNALNATSGTQDLLLAIAANKDPNSNGLNLSGGVASSTDIDMLLDSAQSQISGTLTVVLEGNSTGSLVDALSGTDNRIVIASTGDGQDSLFELGGELSFSQPFWEQVELGATVDVAFEAATAFLQASASPQIPVLEDNGNGVGNDGLDGARAANYSLGAGIIVAGDPPLIGNITPTQRLAGEPSATVEISDVTTTGRIARALAIITPPGQFGASSPIGGKGVLRTLTALAPDRFALNFEDFTTRGEYLIAVYASDEIGQISSPAMTRVVQAQGVDAPGFQINAGISGAWFDPTHDGEGWLIQVLDAETALIYWFTYGPNGEGESRQVWIGAQTGRIEGSNIIIEETVTTSGPSFGPAFDSAALRLNSWGDVTFHFDDCNRGQMYYRGRDGFGQGLLNLNRITNLVDVPCDTTSKSAARSAKGATIDGRFSGAWFDPTHAGEGWLLEILPDNQALSVWFTYDELGRQQWLIGLGQISGNAIQFDTMQRPAGAFFGPTFNPSSVDRARWGSMRFEFTSCTEGTMTYQADDPAIGTGTLALNSLTKIAGLGCG